MRPSFWFLVCALSLNVAAVHAAEEKQTTNPPIDNVVKKVNAEQDEELYRQLSPVFQKAFSLADFRNVLRSVREQSGKLQTWTEQESAGETKVYHVQGEKRSCIVKIVLDKEGRISLLGWTPVSSWGDFGVPLFQLFLTMVFYYVICRIKGPGFMWALFGAVLGPIIFMPSSGTLTLDLMAEFAVAGAALALIFRYQDDLVLPLYRVLARCPGPVGDFSDVVVRLLRGRREDSARRFFYSYDGTARSDGPSGDWLAGFVSELRKRKKLVGLAARVMVDGQVVASAADGERKRGSGVPIGLGDRWHLGSITKSITATMIARLVESGQMQWSDSIGGRFTDASIHEDWKPVTLRQLLTHTAGAPTNFSFRVRLIRPALGPECTKERRQAVMNVIARKPVHRPGKKYAYSNVGYTIAGAMAETVTGVSWEDLVKREVFEPLELTGAGFGPPKSPSQTLDQPRGHRGMLGRKTSASDEEDNTPIMGPAGTVHMTLRDLCTHATEHLRGELGTGKLLAAETYQGLHTPELDNYACGWVKKDPKNEVPHTTYWHNGSNTMWYALVVFIPDKNMTVAVTANDGDIVRAESAAWALVEASANQFNAEGDTSPSGKSLAPGD